MPEQRVIGQKIGARPTTTAVPAAPRTPDPPPAGEAARRRGPRRLVVVLLVTVIVAAAVGWYLVGGRAHGATPQAAPTPVAGQVLAVDAVSVNLAGGHYLRLGMAIQLSTAVKQAPNTSRALDLAIALYSGRSVDEVSAAASRDQLKAQLLRQLQQAYGAGVMDVYLTDYVTQ
jgi:flagellar FliL protein